MAPWSKVNYTVKITEVYNVQLTRQASANNGVLGERIVISPHALTESEFIEADITHNETKEYPYLCNVVAFNDVTILDWVVVSRVRMDKQDDNAYA